jgi:hypothetical protein
MPKRGDLVGALEAASHGLGHGQYDRPRTGGGNAIGGPAVRSQCETG